MVKGIEANPTTNAGQEGNGGKKGNKGKNKQSKGLSERLSY